MLLLACASPGDSDADTAAVDTRPAPAALTTPTGDCPTFEDDERVKMTSNGIERKLRVELPPELVPGLPVVFAWHPMGASSSQVVDYLDLDTWADEAGVIVVVPDSDSDNLFDWDFWNGEDDDDIFFDDVRSCLAEAYDIDLRRVYSTGMSAGGLMTSKLGITRGDSLAAILPMSGGTDPVIEYVTPAYPFPALLTYGGDSDTWGGSGFELDFQAATLAFAEQLHGDGHFVITCNHEGGHDFPPDPVGYVEDWLLPHVYGEPSPYLDDISGLDDICEVWGGA